MSTPVDQTECAIIGAGPAGISAARWLSTFEVPFRWFALEGGFGGLLNRVNNTVVNYPGGCYDSGPALIDALRESMEACGASFPEAARVNAVRRTDETWQLSFDSRPSLLADAVIVSTGTQYRRLDVPGESEGMGTCVSQSATADAERVAGETVAVVGGGDAGFENALILAEHGCKVYMLLRSDTFKARPAFIEPVEANERIEFFPIPTIVERIEPDEDGCTLHLDVDGTRQVLEVACLFVRIGVDPVLPTLDPAPDKRDDFLVVDGRQQTTLDGLFAAGDVTDCLLRSVATAVGSGARAAKSVAGYLGHL